MYGAILGDIIGSRFEFDRGPWTKAFELLTDKDNWTDDSVMTIAIAEALMDVGKDATVGEIEAACTKSMQKWGRRFPNAGYGGRFIHWLWTKHPKPYGSYGNGSAMRVSAVGWLYDSIERTREVARATANVSHNHPEGIKGAECTAAVIFLGRTGKTKEEIKEYVIREFGYDFSESLEEMRKRHEHVESCQDSLPKALRSFFDGDSYEDVVRNAVSLGGDTDTLAAIAGAMAEGFYDIPLILRAECKKRVKETMAVILKRFDVVVGRDDTEEREDGYADNAPLEAAYMLFATEEDKEERTKAFMTFINVLAKRMSEEAYVPMPFVDVNNAMFTNFDIHNVKAGDTFSPKEDVRLRMDTMTTGDGKEWLPLFFNNKELSMGQTANIIMPIAIYDVLKIGLENNQNEGVVINPFGAAFPLGKDILKIILGDYEDWAKKNGIEVPGKNSMYYKGESN